jgi:ATP-dependent DNA helicase RecG
LAAAVDQLRKVLSLERERKFADTAVIGGLDRFLGRFVQDAAVPSSHRFSQVMQSLPPGGYRILHPVQRRRVIEELLKAVEGGPIPTERPAATAAPIAKPNTTATRSQPARSAVKRQIGRTAATLDSPLTVFKGVSRNYEAKFKRLEIESVRDLLFHFPNRYHDYSQVRPITHLAPSQEQTVIGSVFSVGRGAIGRRKGTEAIISDDSGMLRVIWWGQTYIARRLRQGMRVALSGRVTAFRGRLQMENPEVEPIDEESVNTRRLVPVYPSTDRLPQGLIRRLAREALDSCADSVEEPLPDSMREKLRLPGVRAALRQMHFPDSMKEAGLARRRFALAELLYIELGVIRRRKQWQAAAQGRSLKLPNELREGFVESLPFELTGAQRRVIDNVLLDIGKTVSMSRLLEGDVGSGKTVVAAVALLAAVAGGYQGAIMAPTEILAEQHFRTFKGLLEPGTADEEVEGPWFDTGAPGYVTLQPPYMDRPVRLRGEDGRRGGAGAGRRGHRGGDTRVGSRGRGIPRPGAGYHRRAASVRGGAEGRPPRKRAWPSRVGDDRHANTPHPGPHGVWGPGYLRPGRDAARPTAGKDPPS